MKKTKQIKRAMNNKVFGKCGTCGRANVPGHTCKMKFSERNANALRKRRDQ